MENLLIRCPKCKWEPREDSLWECTCGRLWNTFDTSGICPRCDKVWEETACPACRRWSLHIDWYEGLSKPVKKEEIEMEMAMENKNA